MRSLSLSLSLSLCLTLSVCLSVCLSVSLSRALPLCIRAVVFIIDYFLSLLCVTHHFAGRDVHRMHR